MNLAEASAALGKKDTEKNQVRDEIQKLEDLQIEGIIAALHSTVYGLKSVPENCEPTISYRYYPEGASEHSVEHADKIIADPSRFHLASKGGKLVVTCKLTPVAQEGSEETAKPLHYTTELQFSEIPEDTEMRTEVVANLVADGSENEDVPASVTLMLKASVDDIASMIVSKTVELEQLQQEFQELTAQLQEASKKKSSPAKTSAKAKTGGKKTGGKKRASAESSSAASSSARETAPSGEDEPAAPASMLGMFSGALQTALSSGEYLFEKRAYILFPAAIAVFHIYGEYASV